MKRVEVSKLRRKQPRKQMSARAMIREIISRFEDQEFTAADIKTAIRTMPEYRPAVNVEYMSESISHTLRLALDRGQIRVVRTDETGKKRVFRSTEYML